MSPILIAILAVFCCIVGFAMGRESTRQREQSGYNFLRSKLGELKLRIGKIQQETDR